MARKVFLSFLGTNYYHTTRYYFDEESKEDSINVHFVQEATIQNTCAEWTKNDVIIFFLTNEARQKNWVSPAQKDHSDPSYEGLKNQLEALTLNPEIKAIDIKEGFSEKEIWNIFTAVFDVLKENDEIYIDITHAFRFLPMLMMILSNYAKTLLNVQIKHIYYGAFEKLGPGYMVKKMPEEERFAPILDLISFSELQDWTIAVKEFVKFGYSNDLSTLMNSELNSLLKNPETRTDNVRKLRTVADNLEKFTQNIHTVRGKDIVENKTGKNIYNILQTANTEVLPVFGPLLSKLQERFYTFRFEDDICNGFHAAQWCAENNLIQQGITILKETVTSIVCDICDLDYKIEKERNLVDTALTILGKKIEKEEDKWNQFAIDNKETILNILSYDILKVIYKEFEKLSQLRNDINHAGFKMNSINSKNIVKKLIGFIHFFLEKFIDCKN